MKWSDHPGAIDNQGLGPDYVVNPPECDWREPAPTERWQELSVQHRHLIVWDDWGGWYDTSTRAPPCAGKLNCSKLGLRLHLRLSSTLLVVSAYTGVLNQNGTYSGYVFGNTITQGEVHSVHPRLRQHLSFIENNFLGSAKIGSINPSYPFAEISLPSGRTGGTFVLADFFGLTAPRSYTPITVTHPVSYYTNNPAGPEGPGDDGSED